MKLEGNIACIVETRNVYTILFGKPKGKIPLGMPMCIWENNIKMYHKEISSRLVSTGLK
jgi:hypothetical protein